MAQVTVSEAQIQESAYLLWLDEGQPEGRDQEFWFRAEMLHAAPAAKAPAKKAAAKKPAAKKAAPKKAAASKVVEKVKAAAKTTTKKKATAKA